MKICSRDLGGGSRSFDWKENGRDYRLDYQANGAGRFIYVSVKDVEGKRFKIFVPKRRGLVNEWSLLADKIREVGIKVPLGDTARNGDARKGTQAFGSPITKRSKEVPRKPVSEARVDVRGVILIRELGILKFSYSCWKLERYS